MGVEEKRWKPRPSPLPFWEERKTHMVSGWEAEEWNGTNMKAESKQAETIAGTGLTLPVQSGAMKQGLQPADGGGGMKTGARD